MFTRCFLTGAVFSACVLLSGCTCCWNRPAASASAYQSGCCSGPVAGLIRQPATSCLAPAAAPACDCQGR